MKSTFVSQVSRWGMVVAATLAVGLATGSVWSQAPVPPVDKDVVPKDAPKDVVPKDVVPKDVVPKDVPPKDVPKDPVPKDVLPKDAPPRDPAPDVKDPVPADPKAPRDPADPKLPRDPGPDVRAPRDPAPRDPNVRASGDVRVGGDVRAPGDVRASADVRATARTEFRAADVRSADIGLWFNRAATNGLVINSVATRGPIAKLGFRDGDRIVSVNGQKVVREADFISYLFAPDVRQGRVQVIVFREGREQVVWVEPTVLIEEYHTVQSDPLEEFGIILDDRYTDQLVVWRVVPRSPAYYAGIYAGDVLTTFRGQRITTPQQLVTVVRGLQPGVIPVQVMRNRVARTIEVDYSQRRTALRPNADNVNDVERPNERREGRIEDRRDDREDRREGRAPDGAAPLPAPAIEPAPVPRPATPAVPAVPAPRRPGILPRNR